MKVIIDPEFSALIPPLAPDELELLEANIIEYGCRDPLTLWKNILIDGHHRYEICTRNETPFTTVTVELPDREAVMDWMDTNQLGRRNLSHDVQSILRGRIYERSKLTKAEAGALGGSSKYRSDTCSDTAADLAEKHRVGRMTIIRDGKNAADYARLQKDQPEVAQAVWRGEKKLRAAKRELDRADVKNPGKLPNKKYRVLYADPPWNYGDQLTESYGSTKFHYPSMTIAELCQLGEDEKRPVKSICADDAVLFLWVTSPLLEECFPIIKAWGFEYKTSFVWDKVKHNMGHYNSVRHEFLLVCTRGSCLPDVKELIDSVQEIPRGKHSEKPEQFREIIDRLYTNGKRIELFARGDVPANWDAWGNQTSAVTVIWYEDLDADQLAWLEREPPPKEIAAVGYRSRRDIFRWCRWEWARKAVTK